jgi:hypothetical protein
MMDLKPEEGRSKVLFGRALVRQEAVVGVAAGSCCISVAERRMLSFLLSTPYVVVIKVHRVRSSCREQVVVVVVVAWALLRKEGAILCSWEALIVIIMHDVVRFICLWLQRRRYCLVMGAL